MSDITIAIKAQDREIKRLTRETNKLKKSLGGLGPAAKLAAGALGAIVSINLFKGVVGTIRKFEDLRATLVTVEGDATKAAASFDLIRKFTVGTAFQLDEVTNAFITFRNAGLNPTTEFMTNIGNIAAGMQRRFDDVARAVFNATTGEFEMLKQLGIKVKTEGDKLTVISRGVSRTIANDGVAIIEVLDKIGATDFESGIARQLKTLTGAISNLQDNSSELANAIGEGGLTDAITLITHDLINMTGETRAMANELGAGLGNAILFVRDNFKSLAIALGVVIGAKALGGAIITVGRLAVGIKALGATMLVFRAAVVRTTLAMLANPLTAVGVGLAAAGLFAFKDELLELIDVQDDFTESTEKNTKSREEEIKVAKANTIAEAKARAEKQKLIKTMQEQEKAQKKLTTEHRKQLDEILLLNETELEEFARKEAEKQKILNDALANQSISYEEYLKGTAELDEFYAGKRKALDNEKAKKDQDARQKDLENKKKAEDEAKQKAEDTIKGIREGNLDFYKNKEVLEKNAAAVTIAQGKRTVDVLATQNETFFNIQKAIKIAEAVQNTYLAATRALTSLPPPFNFAAAALVTAAGFAQVQQIRASQFPGREKGGPVTGGRPYVVGEAGPEMFVPGSSGTVVPNNRMGGAVTVNFNIQAIDTSDFDDLLLTRQDMIVSLINRAMKERGKRSITA